MAEGEKAYDWARAGLTPPALHSGDIVLLDPARRFDLITAFDVVEHLHDPRPILAILRARLKPEGVVLVSVPNGRSIFERNYKNIHERNVKAGTLDMSGMPHVQFRSPAEWSEYFKSRGFEIVKHDMALGFLVNDCWAGFYGVLIRNSAEPVVQFAAKRLGVPCKPGAFENLFYPHWLVSLVDRWDGILKPWLRVRWGWNLFVLKPGKLESES
jgi:SAM-dependent methyltransferase